MKSSSGGGFSLRFPIAVFLVRIILVMVVGRPFNSADWTSWTIDPDSHGYITMADDLYDGVQDVASTRTPFYPFFIAITRHLFGDSTLSVVLLQQVMDLATAAAVGLMASSAGAAGGPAAGFYLLLPASMVNSSRILPDTLMTLLAAATGLLWIFAMKKHADKRVLLGYYSLIGVICALGAMVKPAFMFVPAVYGGLALFSKGRSAGTRMLMIIILAAYSIIGPLCMINYNRVKFEYTAVSAQDGYEQAGRIWVLTGRATQLEFVTAVKDSVNALSSVNGQINYETRMRVFRSMARDEFLRHPWAVLIPHFTSWPRFFSTGVGNTLRYFGLPRDSAFTVPLKVVTGLMNMMMPLGFLLGAASRAVRSRVALLLRLSGAWFAVMAVVNGPLAAQRYGLVFFPVLSAAAFSSIWIFYRAFRSRPGRKLSA